MRGIPESSLRRLRLTTLYLSERQKWDPPHDDQRLGSIEVSRIIENIRAAFDYMGWTLVPDSG
jgi:hypothetical protein